MMLYDTITSTFLYIEHNFMLVVQLKNCLYQSWQIFLTRRVKNQHIYIFSFLACQKIMKNISSKYLILQLNLDSFIYTDKKC